MINLKTLIKLGFILRSFHTTGQATLSLEKSNQQAKQYIKQLKITSGDLINAIIKLHIDMLGTMYAYLNTQGFGLRMISTSEVTITYNSWSIEQSNLSQYKFPYLTAKHTVDFFKQQSTNQS